MLWQPGDEIVWQEKWRGRTYAALPVRVVLDSREQTAVYLAEGTPFGFDEWPFEGEDWVRQGRFTGEDVAAIRAEGERVLAAWPFPTGWEDWQPDPSWTAPELPDGWEWTR
jgi:hypothetical protein